MTVLLFIGLFAAVAGLYLSNAQQTPIERLRQSRTLRLCLRWLSAVSLCLTLWAAGELLGWEVGIPAWLGFLSLAAIGNLYLAAVSRYAHFTTTALAGLLTLIGAAGTALLHTAS